jgi:hypothetical protein
MPKVLDYLENITFLYGGKMRICDLPEDQIKIGMRVRGLSSGKLGTIIAIDPPPYDTYWWIKWDGEDKSYGGFFWNHCECEVVNNENLYG